MVRGRRAAEALTADGLRDRAQRRWPWARGCSATRWRRAAPRRKPSCAAATGWCLMGGPSSRTARRRTRKASSDGHRRDPPPLRRAFRGGRTHGCALGSAAARRPEPAVRQRRHGAVQAVLPGPGDAAVRPRRERAEVCAHARHRGGRQDDAARHVLRDVRQLLVRRLLQGRGHPARLGPGHQVAGRRWLRDGGGPAVAVGAPGRRRGAPAVDDGHRPAVRAHRQARAQGELLVDGRARPRRTVLRDPLRPRARLRSGRRVHDDDADLDARQARGPLPGVLEPGLHAGRAQRGPEQGGLRHRRAAAEEEHRHRDGPRAGGLPAAGQAEHVRDRRHVPRDREGPGDHRPPLRRRTTTTTSGCGSSRTTCAAG